MPLVAEDIEQVKSIVLETFQEHFERSAQPSPAPRQSESDRKWDLLERIVRVEEELKYLREDMKQLREDMERRFAEAREDMERRFTEAREDMNSRFTEVREEIQKNFKFTVWVESGWGTLTVALISLFSLL